MKKLLILLIGILLLPFAFASVKTLGDGSVCVRNGPGCDYVKLASVLDDTAEFKIKAGHFRGNSTFNIDDCVLEQNEKCVIVLNSISENESAYIVDLEHEGERYIQSISFEDVFNLDFKLDKVYHDKLMSHSNIVHRCPPNATEKDIIKKIDNPEIWVTGEELKEFVETCRKQKYFQTLAKEIPSEIDSCVDDLSSAISKTGIRPHKRSVITECYMREKALNDVNKERKFGKLEEKSNKYSSKVQKILDKRTKLLTDYSEMKEKREKTSLVLENDDKPKDKEKYNLLKKIMRLFQ